jgi:UDP-N-acetylglucosamine 2-epimerase (non-hydrolysing)
MLIYLVAGARPNFMKIAPIVRALQARADAPAFKIIHTGQHYDREMNDVFFEELGQGERPDAVRIAGAPKEIAAAILLEARKILRGEGKQGRRPHLWDGRAAERIVDVLTKEIRGQGQ